MKKSNKIILSLSILGIIIIVLLNIKSPNNDFTNLFRYLVSRIPNPIYTVTHQCKVENQEYHDVTKYEYDYQCLLDLCEKKYPTIENEGFSFEDRICQRKIVSLANQASVDRSVDRDGEFIKCRSYKIITEPIYPEYKGLETKKYYIIIPVLESSCPENYKAEK